MCNDKSAFSKIWSDINATVSIGDGNKSPVNVICYIICSIGINENIKNVELRNMLFVHDIV